MAQDPINVGTSANDGTGDTPRDAAIKLNADIAELFAAVAALPETIRDTIGAALVAGTNITITVDDAANTITISAAGGSSYTDENARDAIGTALVAGPGITKTVDDAGDTITISAKTTDSTPTVAIAAGAGTGATVTIDDYGYGWAKITLTTGTSPASGDQFTLTFPSAFATASFGLFVPTNAVAAATAAIGRSGYFSAQTTTGLTFAMNGALTASTAYKLNVRWTGK